MTKGKRRAYLFLAFFCGGALFVDRVVLSGGGAGPASALAVPAGASPATSDEVDSPSLTLPHIAFPRLSADRAGVLERDFFAPARSGEDLNQPDASGTPGAEASAGDAPFGRTAFSSHHTLGGVLYGTRGAGATVNGKRLEIGGSIGGCELVNVFGRSATFACFDGEVVLIIATKGRITGR